MHPHDDTSIESQLASLTEWDGEDQTVWKKALEMLRARQAASPRIFGMPWRAAAIAASIIVLVALSTSFLISEGGATARNAAHRPRENLRNLGVSAETYAQAQDRVTHGMMGRGFSESTDPHSASILQQYVDPIGVFDLNDYDKLLRGQGTFDGAHGVGVAGAVDVPVASTARAIAHKATIELTTDDVRAVFQKVNLLVQAALGEYVDSSSLTGDAERARAEIVLRVKADRLSDVLNSLREIAKVHAESQTGDDVTDQIIDLAARLRNEMRVEKELLELLESRQDAPLKDILELRNHLSSVRGQIERLEAQRAAIDHLVSLATVLIIIRPEAKQEEEPVTKGESHGAYFAREMGQSWRHGLVLLSDTVSWLVRIVVGGFIWWLLAVFIGVAIRSAWRRHQAALRPAN